MPARDVRVTAVVVALGVAVAVLGLLVVGLLRSHAEVLRRLHALDGEGADGGGSTAEVRRAEQAGAVDVDIEDRPDFRARPDLAQPREGFATAADVSGTSPSGEAVGVSVTSARGATVLAFLTSTCSTCLTFWEAFARPEALGLPAGTRLVAVTKGPDDESTAEVARKAVPGLDVVMSTEAWMDYEVPVAPYVVLVDGPTGRVRGEGAATSWDQVVGLIRNAVDDDEAEHAGHLTSADVNERRRRLELDDHRRERRVDAELAAAGLRPGDPRLHPVAEGDLHGHDHHHGDGR